MEYVIIAAGGTGTRMGTVLPKQFLSLQGEVIIIRTIKKFLEYKKDIFFVISLVKEYLPYWNELLKKNNIVFNHKVVIGGKKRFDSVKNALNILPDKGIVAIHDAVRPFISVNLIKKLFSNARYNGSAVPYINVNQSIRKLINSDSSVAVKRDNYILVQTPQCFDLKKIKHSYKVNFSDKFTDDASVYEAAGYKVSLIKGEEYNIKISTKFDLDLSACLIAKKIVR